MRSLSSLVPAFLVCALSVCALSACPSGSLIGEPCDNGGDTQCEGDVLIRCDGQVWIELAPCAYECIKDKEPVEHQGNIDADETWTCAEGPHLVKETMTVNNTATLTIEAGAMVRIVPAARINTQVAGRIESRGTSAARVLVTSDNGEASGFGGLAEGGLNVFAVESGEPSVIEFTNIERGTHGLGVFGLSSQATPPVIENNAFSDNTNYGILISCAEENPPIPDFEAAGNQFFENGAGDVSTCDP